MTPQQYFAASPEPKRTDLARLHALIRENAPSFEPFAMGSMIGYGKYHYRYASGREGDTCRVGLASNKTGISVYVQAVDASGYLAEQAKARLGKASVGKSCIRFKRLSDIQLDVLAAVLRRAHALAGPGEAAAKERPTAKPAKKAAKPAKKAAGPAKKAARPAKKAARPAKKAAKPGRRSGRS